MQGRRAGNDKTVASEEARFLNETRAASFWGGARPRLERGNDQGSEDGRRAVSPITEAELAIRSAVVFFLHYDFAA